MDVMENLNKIVVSQIANLLDKSKKDEAKLDDVAAQCKDAIKVHKEESENNLKSLSTKIDDSLVKMKIEIDTQMSNENRSILEQLEKKIEKMQSEAGVSSSKQGTRSATISRPCTIF